MELDAFLKENAGAAAEMKARLVTASEEGIKTLRAEQALVMPFVTSEHYPLAVHKLAADVLAGKVAKEALLSTVTVLDAQKEEEASAAAKAKGKETEETPGGGSAAEGLSTDGVIRTAEDAEAAVARLKAGV